MQFGTGGAQVPSSRQKVIFKAGTKVYPELHPNSRIVNGKNDPLLFGGIS